MPTEPDCIPDQPLSLIAWFRYATKSGEEPMPWIWDRAVRPEPIGRDGGNAALERLRDRILRRMPKHAGEYAITPDFISFPPDDVTLWPVVVLTPRPKAPRKPLTEAQKAKRRKGFKMAGKVTESATVAGEPV